MTRTSLCVGANTQTPENKFNRLVYLSQSIFAKTIPARKSRESRGKRQTWWLLMMTAWPLPIRLVRDGRCVVTIVSGKQNDRDSAWGAV